MTQTPTDRQLQNLLLKVSPQDQATPASEADLRLMRAALPDLPPDLAMVYAHDAALWRPGFELFPPEILVDVNDDRIPFGFLQEMVFFADDGGAGFYFMDPAGLLGLGQGAICWVDRGAMQPDAVVPIATDLIGLVTHLHDGSLTVDGKTLGERAIERLRDRLAKPLPDSLILRPPATSAEIYAAYPDRGVALTLATAAILEIANGLRWNRNGRELWPLSRISMLEDGAIALVGSDPSLGHLGITRGDFAGLPADRLISFTDIDNTDAYQILGRTADVILFWIAQEEEAAP